jgi:KDO2-lipid IV(A) lauroyltransferase
VNQGQVVYRTYTTLARCIAALPEPVALALANRVGDALFAVRGEQRRMVSANLARVLDADPEDAALVDRWAHRSFRAYARYWVEGARLGSTSPAEVEERTFVQGLEYLADGVASGQGVIMALPHIGSWEFGGAFLATQNLPMTSVAERLEPPELFDFFVEQRAAMGLTILPLDASSGASVMSTLRDGKLVGLLCDRDVAGNGIEVEFFGEATTMPAGPATLALRTGARLVTGAVYSGPGRDHRAIVEPPLDTTRQGSLRKDVARLTQEIATRFEGLIRRAPEQWHVFQPLWLADRPDHVDPRGQAA